ncbi:diguanylate cyclase domain-containing protein [Shewanella sp. TC10]|uniref:diguanylate cyclase domain-containing protein n=1 Tax=Shewanella sp. TC10 TaxID=1419739 RepID=UPI001892AA0B|nr:diguanylate cyclase [Shewanella sp. TC10]
MNQFDVKQKAIAATIVLVLVLLAITLISLASFSTTQEKLEKVTSQYQPKMLSAMQLTSHFYHSLSVLGNYLIEKDDYNMSLYRQKVEDINHTLNELVDLTNLNPELDDSEQLIQIRILVDEIIEHNISMLALAQNNKKNMPAIGIASDKLEPTALYMNQIVNDLLMVTEANEQLAMMQKVDNLRFNWTMLVSEVRHYLAFRQDDIIDEIRLFSTGVNQSLEDLNNQYDQMDADQQDLLDEFDSNMSYYREFLTQAIYVHASNDWRADRKLMRQNITPTLRKLTSELEMLVTKQQQRIQESNIELSEQISNAERTIRISIQIALAIAILVIFLSFRNKRLASDIQIHKESERRFRHKAHHDSLTQLANRSYFDDTLFELFLLQEAAMKREQLNSELFFGLLYIDLDGFKAVNDNVGHDAGDFILIEAAKRMKKIVRSSDLVCRLGGDEFAIILNDVKQVSAIIKVAEKCCASINAGYKYQQEKLNVSASIGISYSTHPQLPLNEKIEVKMEAITKQADQAMYQAKKSGKNQFCIFK